MKLQYKATSNDGKLTQGFIDAKDIQEAAGFLRARDMLPISVEPVKKDDILSFLPSFHSSHHQDLILMTRQLSSMLTSGLTLMQALAILKDQMTNDEMKEIVQEIVADVQDGKTFSQAIEKYPKVFSKIYISLIRAAESSGFLDKILLRLADNLEKDQKLKATIKSALLYPIIIVTLMALVMGVMMIFVIPQLTGLYQNLNIPLPLPTQIIVGISNFTIAFWPLVLGIVGVSIFGYRKWSKTDSGELIHDDVVLKLPVFGPLIEKSVLTEVARTLGLLIGAGTLVVQALEETADVAGNRVYKTAILDISKRVEKGISIGDSMAVYPIFPPILVQMVKIGEQTGKLDDSLMRVSEYFEREVEGAVKTLTTALEPFIMIVLGVSVAFLIISIITPIYNLTSSIQ